MHMIRIHMHTAECHNIHHDCRAEPIAQINVTDITVLRAPQLPRAAQCGGLPRGAKCGNSAAVCIAAQPLGATQHLFVRTPVAMA